MKNNKVVSLKTLDITYIAMSAVIITICSWISVPTVVPFTLQTFGVFLTVVTIGGKRGAIAVLVYILLGAAGIPVFSGPAGGIGKLLGPTGGYIIGFLLTALTYWLATKIYGNKIIVKIIALITGLVLLYAFGTAWFMLVYTQKIEPVSLYTALTMCVFPFIIPDFVKMFLALFLSGKISPYIQK